MQTGRSEPSRSLLVRDNSNFDVTLKVGRDDPSLLHRDRYPYPHDEMIALAGDPVHSALETFSERGESEVIQSGLPIASRLCLIGGKK